MKIIELKKIGKFNLINETICSLPCQCGWNIHIGGENKDDLIRLKSYLRRGVRYTDKKDQKVYLRDFVEQWIKEYEEKYPTKTIGNHHYIRRRGLEQFLYDYTNEALRGIKSGTINLD